MENTSKIKISREVAYFACGCFWCSEAIFKRVKGVEKVISGYMGGRIKNPSYREVCMGETGHAEVVKVIFNAGEMSYKTLLLLFFSSHDPTSLNRQGADVGTQYRSEIFFSNELQKKEAVECIENLKKEKIYKDAIVTRVSPVVMFYSAELEHDDYFDLHKEQPYCQLVINPKIKKFEAQYKQYLKKRE